MSMDEPSLSEHEQRILAEIERNLAEEDPDFVRHVTKPPSPGRASTVLRLGILGLLIGFGLLLGYTTNVILGIGGFCVMLGSLVAIVYSARQLGESRVAGQGVLRDVLRRAEGRMRPRRRDN